MIWFKHPSIQDQLQGWVRLVTQTKINIYTHTYTHTLNTYIYKKNVYLAKHMCLSKYIYISFKKQNEKSFRLRRCSLGSLRERGVLCTPFTALQCRSHSFLRKLINNFMEGIMQLKRRAAKDSNLFMTWIFGTCILVYTWKQGYIGEWRVPASLFALYLSCMIP